MLSLLSSYFGNVAIIAIVMNNVFFGFIVGVNLSVTVTVTFLPVTDTVTVTVTVLAIVIIEGGGMAETLTGSRL